MHERELRGGFDEEPAESVNEYTAPINAMRDPNRQDSARSADEAPRSYQMPQFQPSRREKERAREMFKL
jgi:hypothetical protein